MEKLIRPLIEKLNKKKTNEIFKKLPEEKIRQGIAAINSNFKDQIRGTISLICATALVLSASYSINYLETHENNVFSTESYSILVDGNEICKVRQHNIIGPTIKKIEADIEDRSKHDIVIENKFEEIPSKAKDSEITSTEDLYGVIKSKINYSLLAYSIKINGKSIGIVETEKDAQNVIDGVKSYFTNDIETESIIEINTAEDVKIEQVKVANSDLQNPEDIENYIIKGTNKEEKYTVEEGDTYWTIAEYFNMSLDDLISANPSSDPNLIQIGDELNLVVPHPFVNVQVKRKVKKEEKIDYETKYEYVSYMYNDEETVDTSGEYGLSEIEAIVTEQNGIQIAKDVISEKVIEKPKTEVIITGTQDPPPKKGTGFFINPLPGSTISSRFGSRSGGFHLGQDMAKAYGSSIKAADGGTVTFAGYSGSYGKMVEIDHGGGFTTRYAHCSTLYVTTGEKVYQGKIIGLVGMTGVTSGPHVHFEVRKYGNVVNPASYIGVQYR
ncbi:murein DD-endopeptidase MepM/ murein hydrolase activator NlpD [Sedimentibacter acidaminivorans]|uniref:Murein DD-endopeptidase MepM/ murein hydrolase activator NlpD n=1 Tax=Sedimentibacter acidaminivorans TaxID=913099 RepID=A0ABS4GFA0_9FIRM|nr:M23 family metallopeptidase [Sedimentibacter acidaminivorans]MBP1926371.1 murein DD-endopeptidase MepM/ murein hydrolase activator NlpD [Sedimentibacter acidaminivorans]